MRGGALPVLVWAALLTLLLAGNWIWAGTTIQAGQFGFALIVLLLWAALLTLARREALKRGPPGPERGAESVPDISFGAVGVALGIGSVVFGLAFGNFMIYFGLGLLALSAGRLAIELRASRRSLRCRPTQPVHRPDPAVEPRRAEREAAP